NSLLFTPTATGPESPPELLTFSLLDGTTACGAVNGNGTTTVCTVPAGASINASTGSFSWTPTDAQSPGTYRFKVQVSDGALTDVEEITVTVDNIYTALISPTPVIVGSSVSYTLTI